MSRKKKRRQKFRKLKCVECNQSSVGNERLGWIYMGSVAEVRSVSKTGNLFLTVVENEWVCCYDCFMEYMSRMVVAGEKDDEEVRKQLKLTG